MSSIDAAHPSDERPPAEHPRGDRARLPSRMLLLAAATAAELALLKSPRHSVASTLIVVTAAILVGALLVLEHRAPRLGPKPVIAAIALLIAASVVTPPRTSNDVWSYAMYGRMVTVHDASPYDFTPADFRHDPLFHRVSSRWVHRASVYGPVFVAIAAADAWIAGPSPLAARLFFQLVAALALAAILVLVWRTARSVLALLFLGLNPVLAIVVVNGGHNDMLIGALLLAAVVLAARGRGGRAGALVGIATLVKLTAGLALIGLVLWAWRHELRRAAARVVGAAVAVVLAAYVPVAVSASHVLDGADATVTSASPWNGIVDRLLGHDAWRNVANPLAHNETLDVFFYIGAVAVLVVAVGIGWRRARRRRPDEAVGASLAAYPVAAEYALPWYAAWGLPMFATERIDPLGAVVWIQSVIMLAALKLPLAVRAGPLDAVLRVALTYIAPPGLLVAFVVVGLRDRKRAAAPPPTTAAAMTFEPGAGALSG